MKIEDYHYVSGVVCLFDRPPRHNEPAYTVNMPDGYKWLPIHEEFLPKEFINVHILWDNGKVFDGRVKFDSGCYINTYSTIDPKEDEADSPRWFSFKD